MLTMCPSGPYLRFPCDRGGVVLLRVRASDLSLGEGDLVVRAGLLGLNVCHLVVQRLGLVGLALHTYSVVRLGVKDYELLIWHSFETYIV